MLAFCERGGGVFVEFRGKARRNMVSDDIYILLQQNVPPQKKKKILAGAKNS
jgi:hypothetical protein